MTSDERELEQALEEEQEGEEEVKIEKYSALSNETEPSADECKLFNLVYKPILLIWCICNMILAIKALQILTKDCKKTIK